MINGEPFLTLYKTSAIGPSSNIGIGSGSPWLVIVAVCNSDIEDPNSDGPMLAAVCKSSVGRLDIDTDGLRSFVMSVSNAEKTDTDGPRLAVGCKSNIWRPETDGLGSAPCPELPC